MLEKLDALFERACAETDGPGSGAAAIDCPPLDMVWQRGGTAPFRIASLTKPFVAAAVHRMIAANLLTLMTPLAELAAPWLTKMLWVGGYKPEDIRIGHLLSHTSGLYDHSTDAAYVDAVFANPQRRWSRADQIQHAMRRGSPYGPPGAVYRYSDTGYVVLGAVVEQLMGEPLGVAVRQLLDFDRIGLHRTWWEDMESPPASTLPLMAQFADGIDTCNFDPSFDLYGGGGLIADAADLARFMRALAEGAILSHRQLMGTMIVPPAIDHAAATPPWRRHGFMLATMQIGEHWVLGQTGHWGSIMLYCPALDVSMAVTLNRSGADTAAKLNELCGAFLDTLAHKSDTGVEVPRSSA